LSIQHVAEIRTMADIRHAALKEREARVRAWRLVCARRLSNELLDTDNRMRLKKANGALERLRAHIARRAAA
jgi:hypothetical protein